MLSPATRPRTSSVDPIILILCPVLGWFIGVFADSPLGMIMFFVFFALLLGYVLYRFFMGVLKTITALLMAIIHGNQS